MGPQVTEPVSKIRYRSGLAIPRSGIYTVRHKQHRLPHEVTLLRNGIFPPCAQCSNAVQFELLIGITDAELALSPFRVTLHQIPEIEIDTEDMPAAAASKEKAG